MSYKNRLLFAYYNILRFYYFKKSLQSIAKTWQVLKSKKNFVLKDVQIPISRGFFCFFFFQYLPAPSVVGNTVFRPCFSQNLEIPYWKSSFPVHWQILCHHLPPPPLTPNIIILFEVQKKMKKNIKRLSKTEKGKLMLLSKYAVCRSKKSWFIEE